MRQKYWRFRSTLEIVKVRLSALCKQSFLSHMPLTLYKTFAWQTFASLRLFTCLVYVSTYCVPIAHLRQNKPFPLLYLGHAQITNYCVHPHGLWVNSLGILYLKSTSYNFRLRSDHFLMQHSLRKQPTFGNGATGFPAKWRLRNERRNSILMMRHYQDLSSASDWSCRVGNLIQPITSTTQIRVVTPDQYGDG